MVNIHYFLIFSVFYIHLLDCTFTIAFETDFAAMFYNIANQTNSSQSSLRKLHLVRIPKASSTSMSIVARRMVGCTPRGPCCKYPGDPPGSCPSKDLFKCEVSKRLIGCTHHKPNYESLMDSHILSITMMRNPVMRSISSFFYGGIHSNIKTCNGPIHKCFSDYTATNKWKNVAVKLLTGLFAYSSTNVCEKKTQCPNSLQKATLNLDHFAFVGISEMWELSLLILHKKIPEIQPLIDDFYLAETHQNSKHYNKLMKRRNNTISRSNQRKE